MLADRFAQHPGSLMTAPTPAPASAPDALLLISSGCPHCPAVLGGLSELVKAGAVGRLEVVNLQARPEVARELGVRSVPWLRLGPFVLEGLHTPAELRRWAERAGSPDGLGDYFTELLKAGQLKQVIAYIRREPARLAELLAMLERADTELTVRIGVSAVVEDLAGSDALKAQLERLVALSRHADAHLRGDAAHFLGLTRDARAQAPLAALLEDSAAPVRELAREVLDELAAEPPGKV
jgi:hypothetical protein